MSNKSVSGAPISKDVALRIALAARALPDTEPARIIKVLEDTVGLPPTPSKLSKLTVKSLKAAADGELSSIDTNAIKEALAYLKGDKGVDEKDDAPQVEAYQEEDIPDSIRVACASNKAEELDGHFGSCARFLIYQVSATEIRLIDARSTNGPDARDDKNAFRADLIKDCQVLFVASIGGPAAAKVVKAGVHPIKYPNGGSARERIVALQKVIVDAPPPWLAKAMGHDDESRVRFERTAAEGSA
jgi:nitrogen fixation protein NifX